MKVLFITSFYSALRKSVYEKSWNPEGMPAISKLFEKLHKTNILFDSILINNDNNNYKIVKVKPFIADFHILNKPNILSKLDNVLVFKIFSNLAFSISNFIFSYRLCKKNNYNIIYVDRANVFIGALFKIFTQKKVVLRLHGITTHFVLFKNRYYKIRNFIRYYSFKVKFDHIISSEDGTPVFQFLEKYTSPSTPKTVMLNGISKKSFCNSIDIRKKHNILQGIPIILFVGRLEADKGIHEFVKSIIKLNELNQKFFAIIIGDGTYFYSIKNTLKDFPNIILNGSIPHADIYSYYLVSDIYVSLNYLGNLSNTVLEALYGQNCIVSFKPDYNESRDLSTNKYLNGGIITIDRYNCEVELTKELEHLITNPNVVQKNKDQSSLLANKILLDWEERIEKEIEILKSTINE